MILVPFGEGWKEGSRTGGSKEDLQIIKTWMCMYHICYHSFGISIFFNFLTFPQMPQRVQRNLIDYISLKIKTRSFSCPKIFYEFVTSFTSLQSCLISCFLQYTVFFNNSGPSHYMVSFAQKFDEDREYEFYSVLLHTENVYSRFAGHFTKVL